MEFILGVLAGWFTAPYILWGGLLFLTGFPFFFWGYDIYEDGGWNYRFWRTVIFMVLTITVFNFFTPFDISDLISAGFWTAVLNLWLYILAYIAFGLLFAYVRFFFYAREYRKRMDQRLARYSGEQLKRAQDDEYRNRLSGYGSRVNLILKWIFHWPWSLLAWVLTDMLRNLAETIFDMSRKLFGGGFGEIARSTEPEWMKEREKAERAKS